MNNKYMWVPADLLARAVAIPSKASVDANQAAIIDRGRAQADIRAMLAAAPQAEQAIVYVSAESLCDAEQVGMHATKCRNEVQNIALYTAPPAPDFSVLVEALEDIAGTHHHSASAGSYFAEVARKALAAHKQEGK